MVLPGTLHSRALHAPAARSRHFNQAPSTWREDSRGQRMDAEKHIRRFIAPLPWCRKVLWCVFHRLLFKHIFTWQRRRNSLGLIIQWRLFYVLSGFCVGKSFRDRMNNSCTATVKQAGCRIWHHSHFKPKSTFSVYISWIHLWWNALVLKPFSIFYCGLFHDIFLLAHFVNSIFTEFTNLIVAL